MSRVLIVDDHALFRKGLRSALAEEWPKDTFEEAETAQQAMEKLGRGGRWDLAVLDISLPGRSGLELLQEIKQARPKLPVLVLSGHSEEQYAVRVMKGGAAGFISKQNAAQEVVQAVKTILAGGRYITPSLMERLATELLEPTKTAHQSLSEREFQILRLLADGKSVKQIASDLGVTMPTISTHRARMLKKLGLRTTAQLIRYAIEEKLVD
jgi:two-component system invasion response regulator UvrY